jgi:CelD/BcsL family acetyltransferase involved in cellulose biosynthesis
MTATRALSTRTITTFDELRRLAPEWSELWSRCTGATSFQRPEWVLSWTQASQPREIYAIEARINGVLAGLAPLFRYTSGSEKVLAPLGASISDYVDWIIDPVNETEVLNGIFDTLRRSDFVWDRLDLTDLPAASALLRALPPGWDCERSLETACPVLYLLSGARSVEDMVGSKHRHNLRTAARRTERAGKARIEIAEAESLSEFLHSMVELHTRRWAQCGNPGMLADNVIKEFHRIAAPALLQSGVLRLYGLRLNDRLIATLYALSERDIVYCYLQGFDSAYGELSPGAQILAAVINDAIRQGKTAVDFLRGREAYKYAWGAVDRETYRIRLHRPARVQPESALAA